MSAQRFAEWRAYAQLEPFGSPAAFWQAGLIASMLANVNRTKSSQKTFTPEDFMPSTLTHHDGADLTESGAQALRDYGETQKAFQSRKRSA